MPKDPVTEAEIRSLIVQWNRLQDRQAGLAEFLPMIAREGFYLEFDRTRWEGYEGLEAHQLLKRRFFDESHDTFEVHVFPESGAVHARTIAHWNAHYRPDGSPHSKQIKTRIEHDWEFRRDPSSGRAVMQGHKVTKFEYLPGFAPDGASGGEVPHLDASKHTSKA